MRLSQMFPAVPSHLGAGLDFLPPISLAWAQVCKQTLRSPPSPTPPCRFWKQVSSEPSAPPPILAGAAVVLCLLPPSHPAHTHPLPLWDPSPPPRDTLGHDLIRGLTRRGSGRRGAADWKARGEPRGLYSLPLPLIPLQRARARRPPAVALNEGTAEEATQTEHGGLALLARSGCSGVPTARSGRSH